MSNYHGIEDADHYVPPSPVPPVSYEASVSSQSSASGMRMEQKQERVEIKDPIGGSSQPTSQSPLSADPILIHMATLIPDRQKCSEFLQKSKTSDDELTWTSFAAGLSQDVLELFVLQTFRSRLQVAHIDARDDRCLRWLCKLYMGYLPNDDQVRNLPYQVLPQNSTIQNVSYIWGHLRGLTDTLNELRYFYHAGYVHLLSRRESQHELHAPGQYLFRMSNLEVGTIIISTTTYHLYLSPDRYAQAGFGPFPSNIHVNTIRRRYVGREFVITQWTVPMIQKLLAQESKKLGLITPMMGAVAMSQLNNVYSSKVQSEYDHLQRDEARYIVTPDPVRQQTRYDQPLQDFPPSTAQASAASNSWLPSTSPSHTMMPSPSAVAYTPEQLLANMPPEMRAWWSSVMAMSLGMQPPAFPLIAPMAPMPTPLTSSPVRGPPVPYPPGFVPPQYPSLLSMGGPSPQLSPLPYSPSQPMLSQFYPSVSGFPPMGAAPTPSAQQAPNATTEVPMSVDKPSQPSSNESPSTTGPGDQRFLEEHLKGFQSQMREHFQQTTTPLGTANTTTGSATALGPSTWNHAMTFPQQFQYMPTPGMYPQPQQYPPPR